MIEWGTYLLIILLGLSAVDLIATYYYTYSYKQWQPDKPYKLIEMNPILVFLWNTFGLHLGMFIGSVVILSLVYIFGKFAHPIIGILLLLFLLFAMNNHNNNINLLHKLIEQYPSGYLPKETFGNVVGNNPIK